jgi:anti-sigma B factor antagonist
MIDFDLKQQQLDDERLVIEVSGEVDLFTAPELKTMIGEGLEKGASKVVIDLSETRFMDSSGLGVLIGAVKRLRDRDGQLTIVNVNENIAKTFEITGLDQIFTICSTREQALSALQ